MRGKSWPAHADPLGAGHTGHRITGSAARSAWHSPAPWLLEVLAHPVGFPLHARCGMTRRACTTVHSAWLRAGAAIAYHAAAKSRYSRRRQSTRCDAVMYSPSRIPAQSCRAIAGANWTSRETIPPGRYAWLRENHGAELRISPYLGSFWLGLNLRRATVCRAARTCVARWRWPSTGKPWPGWCMGAGETARLDGGAARYGRLYSHRLTRPAWISRQAAPGTGARTVCARRLQRRTPLRVELRFNTSTQHRRMAVAVAAMWKQALGVHTELLQEEWKVFVNNRSQGAITQVFRGGWIADYADPASFLDLFRGDEALNNTFYDNPGFDQLLDQAARSPGGQRLQLLQQAETLLLRDTPVIPLYHYVSRHLVNPECGGFVDNPRDIHLSRYLDLAGRASMSVCAHAPGGLACSWRWRLSGCGEPGE